MIQNLVGLTQLSFAGSKSGNRQKKNVRDRGGKLTVGKKKRRESTTALAGSTGGLIVTRHLELHRSRTEHHEGWNGETDN